MRLDIFDSIWNYLCDSISLSTFSPLITFKVVEEVLKLLGYGRCESYWGKCESCQGSVKNVHVV